MPNWGQIKVLVLDESACWRSGIVQVVQAERDLHLAGAAGEVETGLALCQRVNPDLLILSASLPVADPALLVQSCLECHPDLALLVTGRETIEDTRRMVQCLGAGAGDAVMKESTTSDAELQEAVRRRFLPKIRTLSAARHSRMAQALSGRQSDLPRRSPTPPPPDEGPQGGAAAPRSDRSSRSVQRARQVIVVGASTGGPNALSRLVRGLPGPISVPMVAVVHLPPDFSATLVSLLDQQGSLRVKQAEAGMVLRPNTLYVARGGSHLLLGRGPEGNLIAQYRSGLPVNGSIPSVDSLFRSAQRVCGGEVIALLLTGMGADGVEGLRELKKEGAYVVVQDEATSVVWGMPGAAVRAGLADEVVPLDRLGRRLAAALR